MSTLSAFLPAARVVGFDSWDGDPIAAWHAWRSGGIGASDAAAALNCSPYPEATPLALYLRKLGLAPPVAETFPMELGRRMEPVLRDLYQSRTGREVVAVQVPCESESHPFLRATLDGVTADGWPIEFKTAGERQADQWGEPGTDEVPPHYLLQIHQQLIVTGAPSADLAVLIGGRDFRTYTVHADAPIHEAMVTGLADFWSRVLRRDPPPATEPDFALIARLRPTVAATIDLDDDAARLASEYEELGRRLKADEARRLILKGMLVDRMAGHARANLPDGRTVSRATYERKGYTVHPTTVTDFRVKQPRGDND